MSAYDGVHTLADAFRTQVQLDEEDTITVTVLDREAEKRGWGSPGQINMDNYLRTLTIPAVNSRGNRRRNVRPLWCFANDQRYMVSAWDTDNENPEQYSEILKEYGAS